MQITLPTWLTLARIAVIPVIVGLCWVPADWARWTALGLFLAAAATDWFDGWLARRLDQFSELGRFLDPIADKLLITAVLLAMTAVDLITGATVVAAVLILCREILVSGLREFLGPRGVVVHVSPLAKWKTALQMVAIGVLLLGPAVPPIVGQLGVVLLWAAAALTVVTGMTYLRSGLGVIAGKTPQPGA